MYINSISEYLDRLEEFGKEYPNNTLMPSTTSNTFLFRGMEDREYKLLPSVYREVKDQVDEATIVNSKYLSSSNEIGILRNFIQDASAYVPQLDTNDIVRWAELAQHHGVPTRFLDWTENPLVALYFACESKKIAMPLYGYFTRGIICTTQINTMKIVSSGKINMQLMRMLLKHC